MRVLYVSPYPPARDGIGDYTSALAAATRYLGNDAAVLLPRVAAGTPPDVLGTISSLTSHGEDVRRRVALFGPDVLHVQFAVAVFGPQTAVLARRIRAMRRDLGVPVVITMHEVTRDVALLRGVGRALYRRIASGCDLVIVHTEAARVVLTRQIGVPDAKVRVVPHPAARPPAGGAEPAELRARFGLGGARILLAFGFIHVDKGLPDLVRALGLLRRSGTLPADVRLVVAGAVRRRRGAMRLFEARDVLHLRRALRLATRLGVRGDITMTGYVPDDEVAAWFQAAEAAVMPYRRIEQSGVAATAVALSRPVLASRAGGLAEMFGDSRYSFPARDPVRLAGAIADFLSAPANQREPAHGHGSGADIAVVAAATAHAYAEVARATAGGLTRVG